MLVEVIAGTVHLIRRENTPKEQILGVRGYGHTFPEAYVYYLGGRREKIHFASAYPRISVLWSRHDGAIRGRRLHQIGQDTTKDE